MFFLFKVEIHLFNNIKDIVANYPYLCKFCVDLFFKCCNIMTNKGCLMRGFYNLIGL
jgi:hypothetical protein